MGKDTKFVIFIISIVMLFVIPIGGLIHYGNQYTEYEYTLCEMEDEVYAIYYTTHSSIPAHNYEVVTLCCNGNVYTFSGNVDISFVNNEPYAKVRNYNTVNNDDIHVYVPQETVVYHPSVYIGR